MACLLVWRAELLPGTRGVHHTALPARCSSCPGRQPGHRLARHCCSRPAGVLACALTHARACTLAPTHLPSALPTLPAAPPAAPPRQMEADSAHSSESRAQELLATELQPNDKLDVGFLPNGLRYVILPNPAPPERFEAHLEVHAGGSWRAGGALVLVAVGWECQWVAMCFEGCCWTLCVYCQQLTFLDRAGAAQRGAHPPGPRTLAQRRSKVKQMRRLPCALPSLQGLWTRGRRSRA